MKTTIEAASYEILVDQKTRATPLMGLRVNPLFGDSFVIPMTYATAAEIGALLVSEAHRCPVTGNL